MKTATVRDIRNHFTDIAKWIEQGEPVSITRHGSPFATLTPTHIEKAQKADWAARFKRFSPVGKGRSRKEAQKLWSDLRD